MLQGLLAAGHTVATSGAAERQGIVHRLDAGTTGAMVVAKSERAYSVLKQAFRDRTVDKRYHALVQGHPDPLRGTIDAPIARHPSGDGRFAVISDGRPSVTHYDTLEAFRAASLLEVRLETGRTHQIRVHMTAIRHPCVGDRLYGADPVLAKRLGLSRQWLHAVQAGVRASCRRQARSSSPARIRPTSSARSRSWQPSPETAPGLRVSAETPARIVSAPDYDQTYDRISRTDLSTTWPHSTEPTLLSHTLLSHTVLGLFRQRPHRR